MKLQTKKSIWLLALFGCVLPAGLSALYYALYTDRAVMDGWVNGVLIYVAQGLGRLWSMIPFSVGETMMVGAIILVPSIFIQKVYSSIKRRSVKPIAVTLLGFLAFGLWIFALVNWMWNVTYYATGFAERSGLDTSPYAVEELVETTIYFAEQAAAHSTAPERTKDLHFYIDQRDCFDRAVGLYDNMEKEFPMLEMHDVRAKPFVFSHVQSMLGFTGMYFPLTGEANVNVDAPLCLLPVTISHELSHQRLVASEDEANFVGITAAVLSDDEVYQYSGYLLGLMHLSDALSSVAPDLWNAIWQYYVTDELYTDWQDNYNYWQMVDSSVDEVVTEAYDGFLKGNGQELGMQSYGACVDLLVAYHMK